MYAAVPNVTGFTPERSARLSVAATAILDQAASTLRLPERRVVKSAVNVRIESGFGDPWKRNPLSVIDGWSVGHRNATSTVGDDLLGDATVTVQREWAVGAFDVKMGVAPVAQTGRASSTATHSVVESSGDVATISAETAPGPSLTNEKERAEPVASAEPSHATGEIAQIGAYQGVEPASLVSSSGTGAADQAPINFIAITIVGLAAIVGIFVLVYSNRKKKV